MAYAFMREDSMQRTYRVLFFICAALLISGCSSVQRHVAYDGPQNQQVNVEANDTVLVNYIDAVEQGTVFIGQKHTYVVAPGPHVFVIRYGAMFQVDADNHEKLLSAPVKVTFDAVAGKRYRFEHAPQNTLDQARAFARAPQFSLIQLPENTSVAASFEQSLPARLLPNISLNKEGGYVFASEQTALAPAPASVTAPALAPATLISGKLTDGNDMQGGNALNTLKRSWLRANQQERQVFMEWLEAQQP
ncbi:Hypothetical protein HDN1F_28380 [gamma proteobacterium HdN1]|nr:Hypothetical protein HDN1F_28380 [gamma proteobacterium HdN1]